MQLNKLVTVFPGKINGTIQIPSSKSYTQRVFALALLHPGRTMVYNAGISADDQASLAIIKNLGAKVLHHADHLEITGVAGINSTGFHAGESGLALRMFTPIAALSDSKISITGEGSLNQRPVDLFNKAFEVLKVDYSDNNGKLPIHLQGPIHPSNIVLDGSLSSQFVTGFLIALCKAASEKITVTVNNLNSKPYVHMTLQLLEHFGYQVENLNDEKFIIHPVAIQNNTQRVTVEADWSSASCLLVAAATNGRILFQGLSLDSLQADKIIMNVLEMAGANINKGEDGIEITNSDLHAFQFDATDCPDLFPALATLAVSCHGVTKIKGVNRLRHKESDRGTVLQKEFSTLGITIDLVGDEMIIQGPQAIKGGQVDATHDHRIAMSLAVLALNADSPVSITNADAVGKSYPEFFSDLSRLGINITS